MSLLRSTKFVRYFSGAARSLLYNSLKSTEKNTLLNPLNLCSTNNLIQRDYTTRKSESLEPLLKRLDNEAKRFGRITKKNMEEVFDELQAKNNITSSQSLLVIRCCGDLVPEELPAQRTQLVQKIWNVLTERGIPMDISHYNALLRVYLENEHPFSPAKFLEELEKKGLQPNRVTYQRLMWRYCQEGDVDGATKVLEKMRELNMPVSEPVLNALVMGHAFHGDVEGAKAVLETMAGAGLQPSNHTYTLLACGYARKGDLEGVESVIKTAADKDVMLCDKDILDIIEHLSLGNHDDKVESLLPHLHKGFGYNLDVSNLILKLINKGRIETAKKLLGTMILTESKANEVSFKGAFFIKQLLRIDLAPDRVISVCKQLQEEDLIPNAIYIATEAAVQQGKAEVAQSLFKELAKENFELRPHYYWPLLAQKGKEGDEEGLLQILRNMNNEGVIPNGETLKDYVIPYLIKNNTPDNVLVKMQVAHVPVILAARTLMIELLEAGKIKEAANIALQYHPKRYFNLVAKPLVNAFNQTKDIGSFVDILHVISSVNQPLTNEEDSTDFVNDSLPNEIGRVVKSALKCLNTAESCEALLEALYAKGLRISPECAEDIQQNFGHNFTASMSETLTKLTSTELELVALEHRSISVPQSTEALEALLERAKSKGGTNILRLQRQLISAYIKDNNVAKLNDLIAELEKSEFEFNTATLAQLYEFYCQNDDIDKANECRAKIVAKDPTFRLNNYKLVLMAFALTKANKFDEAIQFLIENRPDEDGENSSFSLNSKCWQMLNYIAESKDVAKVKEMTKTLIENNYVEPSNVILGPSIKVHLLNDNLEAALQEFEYCCNNYRSTPWKGELMKALIIKEDPTKLQWLADLSTQIHGEVNILHDLVLAFIECGRLRQARRILETPGLHTRTQRLNNACERYYQEGKFEYLEGLLEATKDLAHMDRSNIFFNLLVTYCKANQTDKALGLWTLLQEEGEVPSDQFLKHLGKHLKANNREVPFVIPSENVEVSKPKTRKTDRSVRVASSDHKISYSNQIEALVKEGKCAQAYECTLKAINGGSMPKYTVLKFLLRNMAEAAMVDEIRELGKRFDDTVKKHVTYTDKLTLAIFNKGDAAKHMDDLVESVKQASTDAELLETLKRFPRSTALARAVSDENLVAKCELISEIAASKGIHTPANLLWIEYVLANKYDKADTLWEKCMKDSETVLFRRLLQESHLRKEPEKIEKLISTVLTSNKLRGQTLGNAYSRLINFYIIEDRVDEAMASFEKALKHGVMTSYMNKTTLDRLKAAVEQSGKEFNYTL